MLKDKMFPQTFSESIAIILFAYAGSFFIYFISFLLYPAINIQLLPLNTFGLFLLGTWFINKKRRTIFSFDFKTDYFKLLPLLLIIVFFYQIGFNQPIFDFYNDLVNAETGESYISTIFFLGAILLGPVIEEIMFRNIILKGMLNTYKPQKAIIISSLLFALIHVKPYFVFNAFLLGLFFCWVFYKTRNITITIIVHSFANFISLFPVFLESKLPDNKLSNVFTGYKEHETLFAIIAFVGLCISLLYLNRKIKKLF